MSQVSLVNAKNPHELKDSVSKAINMISFKPKTTIGNVVIKPNLCYYRSPAAGATTEPQLVEAIIDIMRENFQGVTIDIAEADATAMKTAHVFQVLGYKRLAKKKDVGLFNLSNDVIEERTLTVNGVELSFQIPRLLLEADLFINVPKLKVMPEVTITCALKNMFGAIAFPRKAKYHPHLNEAIVGVSKILKPHLTIVDGLIALGKLPTRLNLILAGENPFFIDWVAAQVLGYDPFKIDFLSIARQENLGNPNEIVLVGERIQKFTRLLPNDNFVSRLGSKIQLKLLRIYDKVMRDSISKALE